MVKSGFLRIVFSDRFTLQYTAFKEKQLKIRNYGHSSIQFESLSLNDRLYLNNEKSQSEGWQGWILSKQNS